MINFGRDFSEALLILMGAGWDLCRVLTTELGILNK